MKAMKVEIEIKSLGDYELNPEAMFLAAERVESYIKKGETSGGFKITLSSGDIDIPYDYYVEWSFKK